MNTEIYKNNDHNTCIFSGQLSILPRVGEFITITSGRIAQYRVLSITHNVTDNRVYIIVNPI